MNVVASKRRRTFAGDEEGEGDNIHFAQPGIVTVLVRDGLPLEVVDNNDTRRRDCSAKDEGEGIAPLSSVAIPYDGKEAYLSLGKIFAF